MTSETTRQGLRDYFFTAVDDDEVMEECVQICTLLNIPPDDLFFKWEAFSFSSSSKDRVISNLTLDGARNLHAYLRQQQTAVEARATIQSSSQSARLKALPRSVARKLPNLPSSNLPSGFQTTSHDTNQSRPEAASAPYLPKAKYTPSSTLAEYNYRYMHEKVPQRSEVLDERIDEMAERVKSHYHLDDIGDPSSMTEIDSVVVGRICSDSEEKPNESSLLIESSRILGSGKRVLLQFHPECWLLSEIARRPSFNLFPGQIVALRGRNGNGLRFVVKEILALPRLLPQPMEKRNEITDGDPSSLFVACGPYSSDKDLLYAPWERLIAEVQRKKPSILVLLGPFVDINNSLVKDGAVTQAPAAYFQQCITSKLDSLFTSVPGISIFLVSSPRDIIHGHIVFPQGAFDKEQLGLSRNIHVLPNPCVFTVNGVNIGVSSVDILSHIGAHQYSRHIKTLPEPLDGVQLLALQLLEQRSFYPLFPVPAKEAANVNLDVTHSHLSHLDVAPDLLIIPSRLKSGHRVVDRTVFVNPGFVSRGVNPDSYASILIPSLGSVKTLSEVQRSEDDPSKDINTERTDLPERIKVEIVKLDL